MTAYLKTLVDHLGWADELVLASLRQSRQPPPRAIEVYAHILGAEHVWMSRLLGRPSRFAVWPALSIDQCAVLAAENLTELRDYVTRLEPHQLRRTVHYTNSAGQEFDSAVEDILLHVALHGAYHRGQVSLLLRTADHEPAPTDFIAYVRGVPAARTVKG
jgi:uncharacterized damage-inducible protein DinB